MKRTRNYLFLLKEPTPCQMVKEMFCHLLQILQSLRWCLVSQWGILVIDEVFDYLDGSKLLAVQYYLSKLVNECKRNNKLLSQLYLPTLIQMCFQTIILRKRISITFLVIHE